MLTIHECQGLDQVADPHHLEPGDERGLSGILSRHDQPPRAPLSSCKRSGKRASDGP